MLVACKQCNQEINKGIRRCPHCGTNNPGYQGQWTNYFVYMGYIGVFFAIVYTVSDFLGFISS